MGEGKSGSAWLLSTRGQWTSRRCLDITKCTLGLQSAEDHLSAISLSLPGQLGTWGKDNRKVWDVDSYCHLTRFWGLWDTETGLQRAACPSDDTEPSLRALVASCVLLQSGVCRSHTPGTLGDICCAQCHTPTSLFLAEDQGTLTTAAHPLSTPCPRQMSLSS